MRKSCLYYYNDLYDKHGTVDQGIVFGKINNEIATLGGMLVQAETMMEAYYRYEVLIILYNRQVEAWNIYAPSRPVSTRWTTVPSKVLFKKFSCFGGCGYDHDTLDYARDTHKTKCGTAKNIDEVLQDAPIYMTQVDSTALQRRTVDDGCGRSYYVCHPEQVYQHDPRTCSVSGCAYKYRNCLPHTKEHSNHGQPLMHACSTHDTSVPGDHSWGTAGCGDATHVGYICKIVASDHEWVYESCRLSHAHWKCDGTDHTEWQCTSTNENGDRCEYKFWRCEYPDVGADGPPHPHAFPAAPAPVFSPSVSLNSQSYSAGGSVSISITSAAPIYGAHLYVRVPGDTSRYGTQIGWFSGNNDRTTTLLPLSYTFPDDAALGTYQIALRVYPWSGSMYGDPSDLFESVTIK